MRNYIKIHKVIIEDQTVHFIQCRLCDVQTFNNLVSKIESAYSLSMFEVSTTGKITTKIVISEKDYLILKLSGYTCV